MQANEPFSIFVIWDTHRCDYLVQDLPAATTQVKYVLPIGARRKEWKAINTATQYETLASDLILGCVARFFEVVGSDAEELKYMSPARFYELACVQADQEGRPKPKEPKSMGKGGIHASFVRQVQVPEECKVVPFPKRRTG
jgi:hypothetical protein